MTLETVNFFKIKKLERLFMFKKSMHKSLTFFVLILEQALVVLVSGCKNLYCLKIVSTRNNKSARETTKLMEFVKL